jgi:hypothetical protein
MPAAGEMLVDFCVLAQLADPPIVPGHGVLCQASTVSNVIEQRNHRARVQPFANAVIRVGEDRGRNVQRFNGCANQASTCPVTGEA